jgi:hypothetical protein
MTLPDEMWQADEQFRARAAKAWVAERLSWEKRFFDSLHHLQDESDRTVELSKAS